MFSSINDSKEYSNSVVSGKLHFDGRYYNYKYKKRIRQKKLTLEYSSDEDGATE